MSIEETERSFYLRAKEKWEYQVYTLGKRFHEKRIPYVEGTKEYVRMFHHADFDSVIMLYSESFDTEEEAQHFADCFFDSFLCEAEVISENGKYVVYTDWLDKKMFLSYQKHDKPVLYYLFANYS